MKYRGNATGSSWSALITARRQQKCHRRSSTHITLLTQEPFLWALALNAKASQLFSILGLNWQNEVAFSAMWKTLGRARLVFHSAKGNGWWGWGLTFARNFADCCQTATVSNGPFR
jgi:hypothetical protein